MAVHNIAKLLVACGLLPAALGERVTESLLHHAAQSEAEEWPWSSGKPCSPADADWRKYGAKVQIAGVAHEFWDSCVKQEDGSCPDTCVPYSEGMLKWRQRSYASLGRVFSGSCKKECRYTDEYMLEEPNFQSFLATSLAVLEHKVAIQQRKCRGLASLLSTGCGARQRKIGALLAFSMKAATKAGEVAANGSVAECQERLPSKLGVQLAGVVGMMLDSLQEEGAQLDGGEELAKTAPNMKKIAQRFGDPEFCSKAAQLGVKMKDPNIMEMMQAGLNDTIDHQLGSSAVNTSAVMATVAEKGACQIVEEQLGHDTEDLDLAAWRLQAAEDVDVSELQVSNWSSGEGASFAELAARDGADAAFFERALARRGGGGGTALVTTGTGALVGAEAHALGFVTRNLMRIWWSIVAVLYHGIIGTIYGVITTSMCLISLGEYTNGEPGNGNNGITKLRGAWRITWLATCPIACMSYGWGINPYHMDDSFFASAWSVSEDEDDDV